jgi:hypothetical protein
MVYDKDARLVTAEATLLKVLSMSPQHARAHMFLGFVQTVTNRAAQGILERERALALDRNLAEAHSIIGLAKLCIGRGAETEALFLAPPNWFLAPTPKRLYGYAGASKPTEIIPSRISNSPQHWRCSARWKRRGLPCGRGLRLI